HLTLYKAVITSSSLSYAREHPRLRSFPTRRSSDLWMSGTVVLVALVAGQSQAMQAAWAEDMLSLLPPIAFLVATRRIRRKPDRLHPYGHHRSIGVAHLVAATALLAMGGYLAIGAVKTLVTVERTPSGYTVRRGEGILARGPMCGVMVVIGTCPEVLGY